MSPALDLGHLNDLNDDVVVEVDVKEALKSSIFIAQKAAAPKSGIEFRQNPLLPSVALCEQGKIISSGYLSSILSR